MDLRFGRVITRRNLSEIPVTDLVIQAVEDLALQQGITTLKFTNNTRQNIYPADWMAGVEYEEPEDEEYHPNYNQPVGDDEDLIDDIYERVDRAELEDIMGEHDEHNEEEQTNIEEEPSSNEEEKQNEDEQINNDEENVEELQSDIEEEEIEIGEQHIDDNPDSNPENYNCMENPDATTVTDEEDEKEETRTRKSGRTITKPSRYNANQLGKIERKHLIFHQKNKNHDHNIEYDENIAIIAAKTIETITHAVSQRGAGFAQQYIIQKGLRNFGVRGKQAAIEE
jgi:hypothetical protein